MKPLERYLIDAFDKGETVHELRVSRGDHGEVYVTVDYAPLGGAPEPLAFEVRGNTMAPRVE